MKKYTAIGTALGMLYAQDAFSQCKPKEAIEAIKRRFEVSIPIEKEIEILNFSMPNDGDNGSRALELIITKEGTQRISVTNFEKMPDGKRLFTRLVYNPEKDPECTGKIEKIFLGVMHKGGDIDETASPNALYLPYYRRSFLKSTHDAVNILSREEKNKNLSNPNPTYSYKQTLKE